LKSAESWAEAVEWQKTLAVAKEEAAAAAVQAALKRVDILNKDIVFRTLFR
jgi:hypothetical protein